MPSPEPCQDVLHVPPDVRRRLAAAASRGHPAEVCGALLGAVSGRGARVTDIVPLPNRSGPASRSYRLDPAELEPVIRSNPVIGFYHSHPDAPAEFSARDQETGWPGFWYVVVGRAGDGGAALAAWRAGRPVRIQGGSEVPCPR